VAYDLTDEQIRFYDENGYLVLRDRIPPDLLQRLIEAGDRWIERGQADREHPDHQFAQRPSGEVMFRVDYLHAKDEVASLELLGSPAILGIAESLAGPNFVPTYESMVFKSAGDGAPIDWHQDAVHPRRHRIFNVDVYLDASRSGEGALRVIPGSQRQAADICRIENDYGWTPPDSVEVELEPGDVLIHDVMIVHGSPPVQGNRLRRTVYYEFRAAEQILSEGPWDRGWVDRRLRLVPLGLAAYRDRFGDDPQFDWRIAEEFRPAPGGDDLRILHNGGTPGTYCSAGSVAV
jgi:ectoine hydroxylase-related dioxygenase (phytanoyl-CoA dioxygenase family)